MRHWIVGLAVAGTGVVLAKAVPIWVQQPAIQLVCYLVGIALAFCGLVIIMSGLRKSSTG